MTKGDVSFALVALVAVVAWLVVVETRRRRKRGGSARRDSSVSSEEAAVVVEDVSSPSKEIAVASPVRSALTARERRVEEVQQRAVAQRADQRPLLGTLQLQALVIAGALDPLIPPALSKEA